MKTVLRSDRRKNPESVEYEYLTFDECKALASESHCHVLDKNGKICQVKITSVKTWKTRPNELLIGWKFGMYEYGKYPVYFELGKCSNNLFVRIIEHDEPDNETIVCIVCNGDAYSLGNLGAVKYYRCQDCGIQFHA